MNEKTLINSLDDFYKAFCLQFSDVKLAELSWSIIEKPSEFPVVVVRSCGKYMYVYQGDFK